LLFWSRFRIQVQARYPYVNLLHVAEIRFTHNVAVLLQAFLTDAAEPRYGYDLMRATGFASGKLYPMLAKLEAAGWLETEMEQIDPTAAGRPPRRWYRLSEDGMAAGRQKIAELRQQLTLHSRLGSPFPQAQGGLA
jgi:PadR family transcriptional regulator, regulatory protein PadR